MLRWEPHNGLRRSVLHRHDPLPLGPIGEFYLFDDHRFFPGLTAVRSDSRINNQRRAGIGIRCETTFLARGDLCFASKPKTGEYFPRGGISEYVRPNQSRNFLLAMILELELVFV